MKKTSTLIWLIPLILILLMIPFIVPSAIVSADAEENTFYTLEELPAYIPVTLENPNPDPLPLGLSSKSDSKNRPGDGAPYAPKAENFLPDNGGYLDSTISVRIEDRILRNTRVFFTFIQIADPTQLRSALANPYPSVKWKKGTQIAANRNTIVAMNGDWFANKDNKGRGTIYRNGELLRTKDSGIYDALIIDRNGDFHIIPHAKESDFAPYEDNILQSYCFPCALVIDGNLMTFDRKDKDTDSLLAHHIEGWKHAQRSVFCQMGTLSYLIITSEGPDQSKNGGLTIPEVARLAYDMGAKQVFNMDGGSSALLLLNGQRINCLVNGKPPKNNRDMGDIIYFATAEPDT